MRSDVLTATTDGKHILSAALPAAGGPISLNDIAVNIPTGACPVTTTGSGATQVQTLNPLTILHAATPYTQASVTANASAINQIVASPVSNLTFVTYNPNDSSTGAKLPFYVPAPNGAPGAVGYVTLTGNSAITAPLAGVFTADDSIFFVSTAGDNKVHYISIPTNPSVANPPTDTQQISPNLPACTPVSAGGNDVGCTFSGTGTTFRLRPSPSCLARPRRPRVKCNRSKSRQAGLSAGRAPAFRRGSPDMPASSPRTIESNHDQGHLLSSSGRQRRSL